MRRVSSVWVISTVAAVCMVTAGLVGCHHDVTAQDAVDTASDVGSAAIGAYMGGVDAVIDFGTDLGAAVQDGDLSAIESVGATRVIARDTASGDELKTVTDQVAIADALKGFSGKWKPARRSEVEDLMPEYALELWQKETVKLGQSEDRVAEVQACTITTYIDSNAITVSLGKGEALGGALSVSLIAPDAASVDALRSLAS